MRLKSNLLAARCALQLSPMKFKEGNFGFLKEYCSASSMLKESHLKSLLILAREGANRPRFLATLPRSGSGFITSVVNSAFDIESGGNGDYSFHRNNWHHSSNHIYAAHMKNLLRRLDKDPWVSPHAIFFSHYPIQKLGVIDLKKACAAVVVRDPFEGFISWAKHSYNQKYCNADRFIEINLPKYIKFYQFWFDEKKNPCPAKMSIFRYESIINQPFQNIQKLFNFWGLEISDVSLKEALSINKREKQLAKIPESQLKSNDRITQLNKTGIHFNRAQEEQIKKMFRRRIPPSCGYTFQ